MKRTLPYLFMLVIIVALIGETITIKGTVTTPGCHGCGPYEPLAEIGEVYLYSADTTLMDSTCIGDLVEK